MFIGNQKNVNFFEKAFENGGLSHAYCLCGPESVGKLTLVFKLAAKILQIKEEDIKSSPNFYYFEKTIDEKTGKIKKEITVSQAREIKEKMTKKSWGQSGQVLVLNGVEFLNEESGNAILKALEEPAEKSFLFLLGDHEKNILPTVLSRCQKVFFSPVDKKEIFSGLISLGYEEKIAELSASFSRGLPGKAIRLAKEKDFLEEIKTETRKWLSFFKMNFSQRLEEMESILSDKDGNKVREELIKKTDFWIELWRDLLIFKTTGQNNLWLSEAEMSALDYNPQQIGEIIDEIINSQNYLKSNIQTRLVVERLLLKF